MKEYKLLTPDLFGSVKVQNRVVMAPMTRCRAIGNLPNDMMAEYYQQRSGAGLIITEGTSPSPNGLGYARIPGIFNDQQVEGWKKTTSAVHEDGGKIFVQLMHTGRISHPLNMPAGARILAPSAVKAAGQMWTDEKMLQDFPVPAAMTDEDLLHAKTEYVDAALGAMDAGFDGVELHGANGYLLEQFISPVSNIRKDRYGGSIENRCRFVIEVADVIAEAIGEDKTAIRLSPYGVASDMPHYPEIDATYKYLSEKLNNLGLAYGELGRYQEAVDSLKQAIRVKPDYAKAYNNLAWIRAACPDPAFRDPEEAVRLARRAVSIEPFFAYVDTLAAALASAGKFEDAAETQRKALLLGATRDSAFATPSQLADMRKRLSAYENGRPWNDQPKGRLP